MTPETKKILMQPLYKIADYYGLKDDELVSFKKRNALLEKVKEKNNEAWVIVNTFIESEIKADRIENDKEKLGKNPGQWHAEKAASDEERLLANKRLSDFCSGLGINF